MAAQELGRLQCCAGCNISFWNYGFDVFEKKQKHSFFFQFVESHFCLRERKRERDKPQNWLGVSSFSLGLGAPTCGPKAIHQIGKLPSAIKQYSSIENKHQANLKTWMHSCFTKIGLTLQKASYTMAWILKRTIQWFSSSRCDMIEWY